MQAMNHFGERVDSIACHGLTSGARRPADGHGRCPYVRVAFNSACRSHTRPDVQNIAEIVEEFSGPGFGEAVAHYLQNIRVAIPGSRLQIVERPAITDFPQVAASRAEAMRSTRREWISRVPSDSAWTPACI